MREWTQHIRRPGGISRRAILKLGAAGAAASTLGMLEALASDPDLVTTDHVLVATWRLLRHRLGRAAAEGFWDGIRSGLATLELVGPADLEVAHAVGVDFQDQDFSLVDRTSFALMQRFGIERVASLDTHFAVFRYGRGRDKAFVLVP